LQEVGHRLEQTRGTHHRGPEPGLEPGGELPLEPEGHRRGGENHGHDEHRVERAPDQLVAHRSTSPMIGSSDPRRATPSLTVPPGMIYGSAERAWRLGGRIFSRYGNCVPSEMR